MKIYLGTFLIALATLALEVTLPRLLSVTTWYHLAFFAISTAMLGLTAGATTVYLKPDWFSPEKRNYNLAKACLGYSLTVPIALVVPSLVLLELNRSIMSFFALLIVTGACSLPFYFSGIVVSAVLTKYPLPIGKLYASDLIGASLGCLLVLGGLEIFDAPSLILLCGSIGVFGALSFSWSRASLKLHSLSGGVLAVLLLLVFATWLTPYGIRPLVVKGQAERPEGHLFERWNSFSRVTVSHGREGSPPYWGPSPLAPANKRVLGHYMTIDGDAGTNLQRFSSVADIDHLRFDVTNVAYYLRPRGGACIIGVGGGRDIQSALLFGHEKVIGIEVNPIFIDLLQHHFRSFAGIADHQAVTLIVDEARSYLSRTEGRCAVLQMSLIDTWASTGAGAFSLSENALYTVEAWQVFLNRLADGGVFTVSRWYNPGNLGETGRIVSLAVASLVRVGVTNPSQHIAMVTSGYISTVIISKQPFSGQDIGQLRKVTADLRYNLAISPDVSPNDAILRAIVSVHSMDELNEAIVAGPLSHEPLNYKPPTDENPYFFHMLRLSHLRSVFDSPPGVARGNLTATLTLLGLIVSLLILTLAMVVVPLVVRGRMEAASRILWPGALYFSLIGAGFMLVEIALIQRLSVFLGHPVYALGILLFSIILSSGIGSFLSDHLPLTRFPWLLVYPVSGAVAVILVRFAIKLLVPAMITSGMVDKIIASVMVTSPLGVLMGFFFPTGMRLVRSIASIETPWYWALNGIFGVLCSALAVFFSIYFGISTNFYIAAACYTGTLVCIIHLYRRSQSRPDFAL